MQQWNSHTAIRKITDMASNYSAHLDILQSHATVDKYLVGRVEQVWLVRMQGELKFYAQAHECIEEFVIGASLSKPHMNGYELCEWDIILYI